jgi:hypothetical protein
MSVRGVAKQVGLENVSDSRLNVFTFFPTLVVECQGIQVGPLDFTFNGMEQTWKEAGLDVLASSEECWKEFVVWNSSSSKRSPVHEQVPQSYLLETLPFSIEDPHQTNVSLAKFMFPLPQAFKDAHESSTLLLQTFQKFSTQVGEKHPQWPQKLQSSLFEWVNENQSQMALFREYVGLAADTAGVDVSQLDVSGGE